MKFYDIDRDVSYTLQDIKNDFTEFKAEDPENYEQYETFSVYLPVLMMDTINGRNDLEIVGLTPDEIERLIGTLFKKVGL